MGLSAKLLVLTIVFVMIAEVLVFVPSVSNFRRNWLMDRLSSAEIAAVAALAVPGGRLPQAVRDELLMSAQVRSVAVKRAGTRRLIVQSDMPEAVAAHFDLRDASFARLIIDALSVYVTPKDRFIRVIGRPDMTSAEFVEIVISETPLKSAMIGFGLNILGLSIIISMITAALVYFALNAMLVRPITRITRDMVRFSKDPENPARVILPSGRGDEIGTAERELAAMQHQISDMLKQQSRLAALGLAVSKISHDLRNMLASAQLISDRLGTIKDPTVERFAPKLISSLDRAIRLCADTLQFGRAQEAPPARELFVLAPLVEEVADALGRSKTHPVAWYIEVPAGLEVDADRDQLYRVLTNLGRNAWQALGGDKAARPGKIRISAERAGAVVAIDVCDSGPGVAEPAKAHLYEAFQGSSREGGTGLGLAIAAELVRAHGGMIELVEGGKGTTFRITLPDRVVELSAKRRDKKRAS
jgi:signal transduction histidine kinase